MTSAPVKDVGSLMNYVGSRAATTSGIGTGSTNSFGDVMSKTSSGGQTLGKENEINSSRENAIKETRVKKSHLRRETPKVANDARKAGATEGSQEQIKTLEEAGGKLVSQVAKELGVSEEEVMKVMEQLGFGMVDLLNVENLTKLALTLSGESDALALLTDEGLYTSVQDLLQNLDEVKTELMAELEQSPEELQQLIESVNVQMKMSDEGFDLSQMDSLDVVADEENTKITVTVEQGAETVKLYVDESGNTLQVKEVTAKDTEDMSDHSANEQSGSSTSDGSKEQGVQTGNPLIDQLLQNRMQAQEVSYEQTATYMTPDTDEIMNQIMDYMKIQIKPGVEQLEMQLHPESLGSLHIQLTSKGGEITAQFHVQNEAVKAAIESQIVELKENLREQGVKVEAVEVTVESHAFESNLWQGRGREEDASYQQEKRKTPRRINLNELVSDVEDLEQEEQLTAEMMEVNGNTVDYMV